MKLDTILCNEVTSAIVGGDDDVYITVNGRRVWGIVSMAKGQSQPINYEVSEGDKVQVWEYDSGSSDDEIGTFYVSAGKFTLTGDGSNYDLFVK